MTDLQKIQAFQETTREHARDGLEMGLHPSEIANQLMLAAMQLAIFTEGKEAAVAGLYRAAGELAGRN